MNNKQSKRLEELDSKAKKCIHFTHEEIIEHNELEFLRNKQNINMRLDGRNKYYFANQCHEFTKHVLSNGFGRIKAEQIESISIVNSPYYGSSIKARLSSGGETDLKSSDDKNELIGFIIGYNEAIFNLKLSWIKT